MKNKTVKSIACAAIMALALSATACGSDDASKTEDVAPIEETEDVGDAADSGVEGYSTLEDYYNDPSVKSALDDAFGGLAQDGMSLTLDVKGNVFTVTCKFEDSSVIVDGIGDLLAEGMEASASQFEAQAASFDEVIGQSGACTVAVRYTDPDDNVLAEKEYKAQ